MNLSHGHKSYGNIGNCGRIKTIPRNGERDLKYIVGENYLCFYAILEMILSDIGVNQFSQYDLANEFGVVLPRGYMIPNVHNVTFSDNVRSLGAHINEQVINTFFRRHKIDLGISYISANPFSNYDKYDHYTHEDHKYIIYSFSYGILYKEVKNNNVGHASLLLNCPSLEQLEIYDPGFRAAGVKIVKRNAMHEAMENIRGGVYIIECL